MVKKTAKIAGSIVGGIVGAVALVLIAYAIYVMTAYYRLDDGLALETQAPIMVSRCARRLKERTPLRL